MRPLNELFLNKQLLIVTLFLGGLAAVIFNKMTQASIEQKEKTLVSQVLKTIEAECKDLLPAGFLDSALWSQFKEQGYLSIAGDDQTNRPIFVGLQAAIEKSLLILHLQGYLVFTHEVIHTHLPATPLCEKLPADPSVGNIAAEITADPARLNTVKSRVQIIQAILTAKIPMVAGYDSSGLSERTEAARAEFLSKCEQYDNLSRHEFKQEVAVENHGATAFASNLDGSAQLMFMINATQAKSPQQQTPWTIGLFEQHAKGNPGQLIAGRREFFAQEGLPFEAPKPRGR